LKSHHKFTILYFLAFFASYIKRVDYPGMPADDPKRKNKGQCGYPSCMETLSINLGIVLATAILVGNTTELLIPYVSHLIVYLGNSGIK
jgi:hypothetical protein